MFDPIEVSAEFEWDCDGTPTEFCQALDGFTACCILVEDPGFDALDNPTSNDGPGRTCSYDGGAPDGLGRNCTFEGIGVLLDRDASIPDEFGVAWAAEGRAVLCGDEPEEPGEKDATFFECLAGAAHTQSGVDVSVNALALAGGILPEAVVGDNGLVSDDGSLGTNAVVGESGLLSLGR